MKSISLALLLISFSNFSYAQNLIPFSVPVFQPVVSQEFIQAPYILQQVPLVPIVTVVNVPTIVQPVVVQQPVVVMQRRFCCLPWFNSYYYGTVSPPVIRY